ncbi:hypothetical protein LJR034_000347 [Caballeronia sp. LjRoot34]
MHADDADLRAHRFDVRRDARREPAAADGDEDGVDRALVLAQDFHRDGALAGDDVGVIERMNEGQATFCLQLDGVVVRVAIGFAVLHDFHGWTAERAHGVDLDLGRGDRHDDDGFAAEPRGRISDALRMISRRCRNHAACKHVRGKLHHLVVRAANLEREHRLVVFALQVDRVVQPRGQIAGGFEFAFAGDVVDARGQDFLEVIGVCHCGAVRARLCAPFFVSENVDNSVGARWRSGFGAFGGRWFWGERSGSVLGC